jgi:hypothetical protein
MGNQGSWLGNIRAKSGSVNKRRFTGRCGFSDTTLVLLLPVETLHAA